MPHYTHRGRSSSSTSSSSHSPAPKHRSRSPNNPSSAHKSSSASSRRDVDNRRRSRSYSPRRRHSSPRHRSPSRQDMRRHNTYHSNRHSPSPRRRSSPNRRRSRSKSPAFRRSSRSPVRRRSPSPRLRYHGSSPSRPARRSREHSLPRESSNRPEPRDQNEPSRSYATPTGGSSSTSRQEVPSVAIPVGQERPVVATQHMVEPGLPRQEWIPGLDIEPEPIPTAASSTAAVLHSSKSEAVHREESREKPVEGSASYSQSHSRDSHDQPRDSRDQRHDSRDIRDSRDSRDVRDVPQDQRSAPRDSRDALRDSYRSTRESDDRKPPEVEDRSRSPRYSQPQSRQSPVGRRHEAERDYNWVHTSRSNPARSGAPTDPVKVSVNLPASPGDMDMGRGHTTTAPWEKKRQDQENYRSQREAERQHAGSRSRDPEQHARSEPHVAKLPVDASFMPSSASRGSLSNRFGAGTANAEPFYPTENITVGIQRNLKDGDDRIPVKRHFVEAEVIVPRRKDEGSTPLSLREEFVTREEEVVEERRVVKVEAQKPSRDTTRHANFEVRREPFPSKPQSLSERWKERDSRHVEESRSSHHRENSRESRKESYRSREDDRRRSPPRDERRVSDSGRSRSQRHEPESHRLDDSWERKRGRYEIDPGDLRHNLATKRNRSYDEKDDHDVRSRIGERGDSRGRRLSGGVEDFSKREDKYAYEEWKDKPEMIPKGSSYYEHDNRDTYTSAPRGWGGARPFRGRGFRGRGRGFTPYRGRGSYRGWSFRGRPFSRGFSRGGYSNNWRPKSSDGEREWKHDKFKEIHEDTKDNKDEKPTSTTEK